MSSFVLHQRPDGAWMLTDGTSGDEAVDGWQGLARLLADHRVEWAQPQDLNRFRGQFGEPPADFPLHRMSVHTPG